MAARRTSVLLGRASERQMLDRLLDNVRGGQCAVLVVRGDAGVGKTALLHYCARQASGVCVAQIAGVEAEVELPFAALHQLCAPMLARLDALPEPQRDALRVAFGMSSGVQVHAGNLAVATSLIEELDMLSEAIGVRSTPYGALALAAWRGREADARDLIDAITAEVTARSEGMGLTVVHWATAVLYNGLGRYGDALAAALRGSAPPDELGPNAGCLIEVVEAAVRSETPAPPGGDRAAWPHPRPTRRRAPISSTASGCAASAGAWTLATGCARRTRCSWPWGWRRSPSAPVASCRPPARPSASAGPRLATSSRRRSGRSRGSPATGSRTPRSVRGSSPA